MAWPWTSPELLRLWLTNTRKVRLLRICARSRTLPGLVTSSGPSRRATAAMGSSNVRHNTSNAEGRIIRSPEERILPIASRKTRRWGTETERHERRLWAQGWHGRWRQTKHGVTCDFQRQL